MKKVLMFVSILHICSPAFANHMNETWHDFEFSDYKDKLADLKQVDGLKIAPVNKVIKSLYILSYYYCDKVDNNIKRLTHISAAEEKNIPVGNIALNTYFFTPIESWFSDIYYQSLILDHLKKQADAASRIKLFRYWNIQPINFALAVSKIPEDDLNRQLMYAQTIIESGVKVNDIDTFTQHRSAK